MEKGVKRFGDARNKTKQIVKTNVGWNARSEHFKKDEKYKKLNLF